MTPCIALEKASTLSLGSVRQPVVTRYQIGVIVFRLYRDAEFQGQALCIRKDQPDAPDFNRALANLTQSGVLSQTRGLPAKSVFTILGKEDATPAAIACSIDPFAYLSHLSAMEFHALTDRLPKILYLSTPPPAQWKEFARQRMLKDLGEDYAAYGDSGFPPLTRVRLQRIKGRTVQLHSASHLGAFKVLKDSPVRVATIGRTFLDMIRRPDLCGGIRHVIDVYQEHASTYLSLITAEIDTHGQAIDKVRAGYILDEVCHLDDSAIRQWRQLVQRGGSRKLDAASAYSSQYSERWCLSLNLDEV